MIYHGLGKARKFNKIALFCWLVSLEIFFMVSVSNLEFVKMKVINDFNLTSFITGRWNMVHI